MSAGGLDKFYSHCERCMGGGLVSSEAWVGWRRAFSDAEKLEGLSIVVAGYFRWQDNYIAEHPLPDENEEVGCPDCDTTGLALTPEGSELVGFLLKVGFVKEWQLKQSMREAVRQAVEP